MQKPSVQANNQKRWHVQQEMAYCDCEAEKREKQIQIISSCISKLAWLRRFAFLYEYIKGTAIRQMQFPISQMSVKAVRKLKAYQ